MQVPSTLQLAVVALSIVVAIIPVAKILRRIGYSGWWVLLVPISLLNLSRICLYTVARGRAIHVKLGHYQLLYWKDSFCTGTVKADQEHRKLMSREIFEIFAGQWRFRKHCPCPHASVANGLPYIRCR